MYLVKSEILSPDLTIVIPTYQRPQLLKETIDSCIRIESEFEGRVEVLIVDNEPSNTESNSEIEKMILEYKKPYLSYWVNDRNLGMFGNWNKGLELSQSEWVTILHDDDLVLPNFVQSFFFHMKENSMDLLAFSNEIFYDRAKAELPNGVPMNNRLLNTERITGYDYLVKNQHLGTLGIFFNRNRFEGIHTLKWFDENYGPSSDYAFFAFGSVDKKYFKVNLVTSLYRIESNASLKLETLRGFVTNDLLIKHQLMEKMGITSSFLKKYLPYVKYSQLYTFRKLSNDGLIKKEDISVLESEFHINNKFYIFFRTLNKLLFTLLKIKGN